MLVIGSIFFLIVLKSFDQISCLVELPSSPAPDNEIVKTEANIRNVTNNLFSLFNLDPSIKEENSNFTLVYNYLASLALRDYNTLNEIARLTKVDTKNINQNVTDFMTVINEILDETPDYLNSSFNNFTKTSSFSNSTSNYSNATSNNDTLKESTSEKDVEKQIETFVNELKALKERASNSSSFNEEVHNTFSSLGINFKTDLEKLNSTTDPDLELLNMITNVSEDALSESDSEENYTIADDSDFWVPSGRRIYKGKRTKIKTYPFMASVHIFRQFTCAGSIIKSDLIITAASCLQLAYNNRFFRENPKFLSVIIGSTFYTGGGEEIDVLEVFFHPSYTPDTLKHNLAIMRLQRNIHFSKRRKKVKKIKMDRYESTLPHTTPGITVVGWGARDIRNNIKWPWSQALSYAILDVYHIEDCMDVYSKTYVTKQHFCAGYISKGGGACNRDVGGPGVVDGILVGVISFGPPTCGKADSPTVFTKLGYYTEWIDDIMEQEGVATGKARTTTTLPPSPYTRALTTTESYVTPIPRDVVTEIGESAVTKGVDVEEEKNVLRQDFFKNKLDISREIKVTKAKISKKDEEEEISETDLFKNFVRSVFGKEGNDYIEELNKDEDLRNNQMYKEFVETVLEIKQKGIDNLFEVDNAITTGKNTVKVKKMSPKRTTKLVSIENERPESEETNIMMNIKESSNEKRKTMRTHYTKPIYDEMLTLSGENKKSSEEQTRFSGKKIRGTEEKRQKAKRTRYTKAIYDEMVTPSGETIKSSEESSNNLNDNKIIQMNDDDGEEENKNIARMNKEEEEEPKKKDELVMVVNKDSSGDKELDDAILTLMYIAENAKREGLIDESDFNTDTFLEKGNGVVFRTDQQTPETFQEPEELNLSQEIYEILAETLKLSNITVV